MLTLLQFVCLDNLNEIYRPLIEKDPLLALYFVGIILVVCVVLMNLIGAVIFASALEANQSEEDSLKEQHESDWAQLIGDLKAMFSRIDEDQSGMLSLDEFMEVDKDDKDALCAALEVDTPMEIFKL